MTLSANAAVRLDHFSAAARLRMVDDRPANEDNSAQAHGYSIVDLSMAYRLGAVDLFINVVCAMRRNRSANFISHRVRGF